jgi:hypothetical protein
VKRIVITEGGLELRAQMEDQLLDTLLPLAQLTGAQRVELRDLLALATSPEPADGPGDGAPPACLG